MTHATVLGLEPLLPRHRPWLLLLGFYAAATTGLLVLLAATASQATALVFLIEYVRRRVTHLWRQPCVIYMIHDTHMFTHAHMYIHIYMCIYIYAYT